MYINKPRGFGKFSLLSSTSGLRYDKKNHKAAFGVTQQRWVRHFVEHLEESEQRPKLTRHPSPSPRTPSIADLRPMLPPTKRRRSRKPLNMTYFTSVSLSLSLSLSLCVCVGSRFLVGKFGLKNCEKFVPLTLFRSGETENVSGCLGN